MRPSVSLTPEERAHILDIQDRLIEVFVERGEALAAGDEPRADALQSDIDNLLRELDAVRESARADGR